MVADGKIIDRTDDPSPHFIYLHERCRDRGALHLYDEALKAFNDTIRISRREAIAQEGTQKESTERRYPTIREHIDMINLENVKTSTGFELALKAILLENDYVVHEIDRSPFDRLTEKTKSSLAEEQKNALIKEQNKLKNLAEEQKNRPINKLEVFEISGGRFDDVTNNIFGLTWKSLSFNIILKTQYRKVVGLSPSAFCLINKFRNLRNEIHLPPARDESHSLQQIVKITESLVNFINLELKPRTGKTRQRFASYKR